MTKRSVHPAARLPYLAYLAFLALVFTGAVCRGASADPAWNEVSRSEDVIVYRKEVPGSPVLAYKAVATLAAPLARVIAVVRDTARFPEWTWRVKFAEVVQRSSPTEALEYLRTGAPWPVKDRDALYRSRVTYDRAAREIRLCIESVEDPRRPEHPDYVRARVYPSCFRFNTPDGGRTTRIEAEVHGDPRGAIPKWVVNLVQRRAPEVSVRNLSRRVQAPGIADDPQTLEFLAPAPHQSVGK
jgi:hypothetical protein